MSQHSRFEKTFHDDLQPEPSYEDYYVGQRSITYESNGPAQKLRPLERNKDTPTVNARLVLAIISLFMVLGVFLVTLGTSPQDPLLPLAIVFSLVFASVVIIVNYIFNRSH